ncbi:MAG: DUF2442 domain-containing protein [Planctomycetota bacterium]
MNPRVQSVVARDDYKLKITFTNGEVGLFDCSHLLTFGVFRALDDIRYFRRARVLHGTVAWPHEQDICPDTLYEDSVKVAPVSAEQNDASEPDLPAF